MCDICGRTPCDSRCPNAPDPDAIFICKWCHEPIAIGEEYLEFGGDYYHLEECASDAAISLLTKECGARIGVAEEEDICH